MSASEVNVFVLDFPNPEIGGSSSTRIRVPTNISYDLDTKSVTTLSSNTVSPSSDIEGLLFVPELAYNDPCLNASAPYVPNNVTRRDDLPSMQYQYVGFAPWISPECTRSYLSSVRNGVSAFIFYPVASNDSNSTTPPSMNDPLWDLGDNGRWKTQYLFPVYALAGVNGPQIMQQMAHYSGNITQAPYNTTLIQDFDITDFVRVYATLDTDDAPSLPTLWAFLLIVLGVVLVIVALTSIVMHFMQRRHRRDLQRRVENGEVDLEMLGIKKQRLSQSDIDALPLAPYTASEKKPTLPAATVVATKTTTQSQPASSTTEHAGSPQDYNQPTCPICLEDYINNVTTVRSLPCHHIFHPECIDRYLLDTSSLCPICKQKIMSSASNQFVCPSITNAMVRRERFLRRLEQPRNSSNASTIAMVRRMNRPHIQTSPSPQADTTTATQVQPDQPSPQAQATLTPAASQQVEFAPTDPSPAQHSAHAQATTERSSAYLESAPADPERRREWARRRASALLGDHHGQGTRRISVPGENRATGGVRGLVRTVFPGFR